MKRDFTPRRRGKTYCSPGCGRGCTFAEFEDASAKAEKLAAELGPKWKPDVWENLGWHYAAKSDLGTVHRFGPRSYWADLKADNEQFEAKGTTPRRAFWNAVGKARAARDRADRLIEAASDVVKKKTPSPAKSS